MMQVLLRVGVVYGPDSLKLSDRLLKPVIRSFGTSGELGDSFSLAKVVKPRASAHAQVVIFGGQDDELLSGFEYGAC